MKNIHIIPTDKPSRFFEILQFNFVFDNQNKYSEEYKKLHKYKNKNIYITSDEEIKEGCLDLIKYKNHTLGWYLMIKNNSTVLIKYDGSGLYFNTETTKIFKIIITTDPTLIDDGVQAIDDGFLEWFVKNPSCEEVEVIKTFEDYTIVGGKSDEIYYKIIIPKEEQKQHLIDMMKSDEELGLYEEPKQEITLEEVAKNYYNNYDKRKVEFAFIDGAKWQQERSYSEEEVNNLISNILYEVRYDYSDIDIIENNIIKLFEQFKKK